MATRWQSGLHHPVSVYAKQVTQGRLRDQCCKYEILACQRHLDDLKRQGTENFPYVFDTTRADRIIRWFGQCIQVRGVDAGKPITLEPWQVFDLGCTYGWVHKDTGARRFTHTYNKRARGNYKSSEKSCQGLHHMCGDAIYPPYHPELARFEQEPEVECAAVDRGQAMVLPNEDVAHYKAATRDGLKGVAVLRRADEVISSARAQQQYELGYYENGGQPSGVLRTDTDLSGKVDDPKNPGQKIGRKDLLRREWDKVHAGPRNSHRIAILDYGLDYKPLAASNSDAQFIESKEVSIRDIARYFGVPLYKLQEGKQAYGSNEQNAIEYVVSTLHPIVTQYEEELTWKLLTASQVGAGLELRINMMAELRGDTSARGQWYKDMLQEGAFSVNDVRALEDLPDVPGGHHRRASLNYVPLQDWPELSRLRAGMPQTQEE